MCIRDRAKGWITAEDVAKAKEIIATVSAEKAAHLPEQMIQNIACLLYTSRCV